MVIERVRVWRPVHEDRVLLMAGETTQYAIEPRGEYVFGIVARRPMRSRRGRERRLVQPGQLVAWDPSAAHSGAAVNGRPWSSRLMIVEVGHLDALTQDDEDGLEPGVAFPEPVLDEPELTESFLCLHAALDAPTTRLERDERLATWLAAIVKRAGAQRPPRSPLTGHDDRAMRLACDYLGDQAARNVSLDELAAAAEIGKFRLIRLFRQQTGLPPHALQIAHRIRRARRLIEAGDTIVQAASTVGFADQSHLHRHFHRSLGITPGEYQRRLNHR